MQPPACSHDTLSIQGCMPWSIVIALAMTTRGHLQQNNDLHGQTSVTVYLSRDTMLHASVWIWGSLKPLKSAQVAVGGL